MIDVTDRKANSRAKAFEREWRNRPTALLRHAFVPCSGDPVEVQNSTLRQAIAGAEGRDLTLYRPFRWKYQAAELDFCFSILLQSATCIQAARGYQPSEPSQVMPVQSRSR